MTMTDPTVSPPLFLSHDEMRRAYDQGSASLLSGEIDGIIHHSNTWWVVYERGWLRITDEHVLADLDQAAERLAVEPEGDSACSPPRS
jgi:hypothetical protein